MLAVDGYDELSRFILPIMTALEDGHPICAGSCVIITTAKKHAIALTAKHVIDFIEQLNGRDDTAELQVAPQFRKRRHDETFRPMLAGHNQSFDHNTFVLLPSERSMALLMNVSLFPGGELDIAAIGLEIGIGAAEKFPMQCRIMSNGPTVGDSVILCGFPEGNAGSFVKETGKIEFDYKIQTLSGHVIEKFGWSEDYFVRSPGFRIDVGAPSGFSGGAVLHIHHEYGPVLCGIISASDEQRTSAANIFPALGLDNVIPHTSGVPDSILGLCSLPGALHDLHDAPSHLKLFSNEAVESLQDHIVWSEQA